MIDTVLTIDIGTTSLKAGFISATGEVVSFYSVKFLFPADRFIAKKWLKGLKKAVAAMQKKIANQEVNIKGIVVSGNGPTLVSRNGLTLRWNEPLDYEMLEISTMKTEESLFLPRIMAFQHIYQKEFNQTNYIFSGPEYLIYQLSGFAVTILPEKRFEGAYWNGIRLKSCGISLQKMPSFVSIGEMCGTLRASVAQELNLPPEIPVFAGGPDFIVALIGTNTLTPGRLCDRCGSSEGYNFCTEKYVFNEHVRTLPSIMPGYWNVSYLIPGSSQMEIEERLEEGKKAINILRQLAKENGLPFPKRVVATGGQTKDLELMKKKSEALGLQFVVSQCADAELLGDACVGWYALGEYSSIIEASFRIIRENTVYGNS